LYPNPNEGGTKRAFLLKLSKLLLLTFKNDSKNYLCCTIFFSESKKIAVMTLKHRYDATSNRFDPLAACRFSAFLQFFLIDNLRFYKISLIFYLSGWTDADSVVKLF
jgi:hypothetical protein